ncbi:hypothetical protein BO71DRAFT_173986 [Aspergillus ellipticus CBS 707.79]|uniref:Uncharacterized protein n=1 Tax=Aspergillus ellipticus CBS 707.79 TaxID=1448320 RepID=A0A319EXP3_9EURO|nr:hypothetical protein BO71DRAFT_173986 [Aspergillus ellipticus CBS 707.79]
MCTLPGLNNKLSTPFFTSSSANKEGENTPCNSIKITVEHVSESESESDPSAWDDSSRDFTCLLSHGSHTEEDLGLLEKSVSLFPSKASWDLSLHTIEPFFTLEGACTGRYILFSNSIDSGIWSLKVKSHIRSMVENLARTVVLSRREYRTTPEKLFEAISQSESKSKAGN